MVLLHFQILQLFWDSKVVVGKFNSHLETYVIFNSRQWCELAAIQSCLTPLQVWFYTNGMTLNPDKSHAILFGTAQRAQSFSSLQSIDVAGSATSLVSHIKLLGVTLVSHLTMTEHTKLVSQSSFYHIRALRHIRGVLDCCSHSLSLDF